MTDEKVNRMIETLMELSGSTSLVYDNDDSALFVTILGGRSVHRKTLIKTAADLGFQYQRKSD